MQTKLDMLDFLLLSTRETQHLDSYDVLKAQDASGYGQRIRIKALAESGPYKGKGDTWDISLYDEDYIYDFVTELAYHTPRDYKKFVLNHQNAGGTWKDGIKMYPRFVDASFGTYQIATPKERTLYRIYKDCKLQSEQSLGNVTHNLCGPVLIDHGGDIGLQPTMIQEYFWNDNGKPVCEENYLVYLKGWVRWLLKAQNQTTGIYEPVLGSDGKPKMALHTKLNPGGSPGYIFPCWK